jgi:hypothetical protein
MEESSCQKILSQPLSLIFPEIIAIINSLKLYLVAPAIMGMESPTIGIHGEMKK